MFNAQQFLAHQAEQDRAWALSQVHNLPSRFKKRLLDRREKLNAAGGYAGNAWLIEQSERYRFPLPIAGSNDEIIAYAQARADECFRLAGHFKTSDAVHAAMLELCRRIGVKPPSAKDQAGQMARAVCPLWWRRAVRKAAGRAIEKTAIDMGLVHRNAGIYASDESVQRRAQQKRRNRALLESLKAVNELGQEFTLADLADLGTSNAEIRRGELMTRIAGFEHVAASLGHVGEFYTMTAPSRFHARHAKSGERNHKWNESTPRQAQQYLSATWARARAALHRRGVRVYGFRVAEAHHDGTPHWHMLFFMAPEAVQIVRGVLAEYATREDRAELGADISPRFKAVSIDRQRGSAAGYIAKYIAKNIDGYGVDYDLEGKDAADSAARVDAWASCWGIRQFQQIGGPPVSVWREARRLALAEMGAGDLLKVASAADAGDWGGFVQAMGGASAARKDHPVKVFRETADRAGRYGDEVAAVKGLLVAASGEVEITRKHTWIVKRSGCRELSENKPRMAPVAEEMGAGNSILGFEVGPILAPWSSVNNCTGRVEGEQKTGSGGRADQGSEGEFQENAGILQESGGASDIAADGSHRSIEGSGEGGGKSWLKSRPSSEKCPAKHAESRLQ